MALFDHLKQQMAQGADAGAKGSYTVTLSQMPVSLQQLQAMPEGALLKPEHTAALTVAVLCLYPLHKEAALQMLEYLQGPKGLSTYDKQFLQDRFRDKDYVPRSYLAGATPQNNYEPSEPYTVTVFAEETLHRSVVPLGTVPPVGYSSACSCRPVGLTELREKDEPSM